MSLSQLPPGVAAGAGDNKTLEFIIGKAFKTAEETCTSPWVLHWSTPLPGVPITFHTLLKILSSVACIFNCTCCIYLITGHIAYWVRPDQQRQIIRIILFDAVFSITTFFGIYFYGITGYIHPAAVCYEGFAMTAIFLLYIYLVCPNVQDRAQYFTDLQRQTRRGKAKEGSNGSLSWFRTMWILVFQVTFTRVGTLLAQEILYGLTCPLSTVRANGSIAIQVVQGVSTGITVYGVVNFERRMHKQLTNCGHQPMLKLVSFKAIVGIEGLQDILFASLGDSGVYFPKSPYHVSWSDFSKGVPQILLSLEMVVVTVAFLWSFSFEDYQQIVLQGEKPFGTVWRCLAESLSPVEIWQGVKYMFTCFTGSTYLEGRVDGRYVPLIQGEDFKNDGAKLQVVAHDIEPVVQHNSLAAV